MFMNWHQHGWVVSGEFVENPTHYSHKLPEYWRNVKQTHIFVENLKITIFLIFFKFFFLFKQFLKQFLKQFFEQFFEQFFKQLSLKCISHNHLTTVFIHFIYLTKTPCLSSYPSRNNHDFCVVFSQTDWNTAYSIGIFNILLTRPNTEGGWFRYLNPNSFPKRYFRCIMYVFY